MNGDPRTSGRARRLFGMQRAAALLALLLVAALAISACGGDDKNESSGSDSAASGDAKSGDAAPAKVAPLTVALATTQTDIMNYIAREKGFFEEEGVDVTIQDNTQANTTPLVVSGKVDIGALATTGPLAAAQQGAETVVFYALSGGGVGGTMISDGKEIKTPEDLAKLGDNCKIGTFPAGTSSYGYGALYAQKLNPKCQVTPLQDAAAEVGALASGRVSAVVGGYAFLNPIVQQGKGAMLVDTTEPGREKYMGPDFVEVGFFGLKKTLDEKRESVVRYIKAIQKAREFVLQNDEQTIADTLAGIKVYAELPPEALKDSVAKSAKVYIAAGGKDGYIEKDAWDFALTRYQFFGIPKFDAKLPAFGFDERVDMSFYEEALGAPGA
jgi:NitT/TauT family transport system substrate-binding protein